MRAFRRRIPLITVAIIWMVFSTMPEGFAAESLSGSTAARIKGRIEGARGGEVVCHEKVRCRSSLLPRFYSKRDFLPAWSGDRGVLPVAESMERALGNAGNQGLQQEDYHLREIESILKELGESKQPETSSELLVDLDLLLTDAFFLYGSDVASGRLDPAKVEPNWHIKRNRPGDLQAMLQRGLPSGSVGPILGELMPHDPRYSRLAAILADYREAARRGGWQKIPAGKTLKKGDRDERVAILRDRLRATSDVAASVQTAVPDLFDEALEAAVITFQKRHGLEPDGQAGRKTLEELNVPAERRIRTIEVNMERWRWLPRDLGDSYVWVNIPGFELEVFEKEQILLSMEIIVGKAAWSTPIFRSMMTDIVLNPYWYVPPSIAVKEVIPRVRRDRGYLGRENIRIIDLRTGRFVNPRNVNWSRVPRHPLPYRFRQEPGPKNALGRIKFLLPNPYDVYLHDTPERHLFERAARGFSHGCIRIEKPMDLALYLLRGDPEWTKERILSVIETEKIKQVKLPIPIRVYVVYFTAWVNADGTVQFRDDIYKRDEHAAELERN